MANIRTDAFLNRFGDSRNVIGTYAGGFDIRSNRMVMYESPSDYKAGYKILYKTESGAEKDGPAQRERRIRSRRAACMGRGRDPWKDADRCNDSTPSEAAEYGLRLAGAWRMESLTILQPARADR